jgi:hypothetical protein
MKDKYEYDKDNNNIKLQSPNLLYINALNLNNIPVMKVNYRKSSNQMKNDS